MIADIRKYATGPVARGFLFAVAASFVIGMAPVFLRQAFGDDPDCAISVNEMSVSRNAFEQESRACRQQQDGLRKRFGDYVDQLMPSPRAVAHESLVRCALLDEAGEKIGVKLHDDYVTQTLSRDGFWETISPEGLSQQLAATLPYYRTYVQAGMTDQLRSMGLSVAELEAQIDKLLVRDTSLDLARSCAYVPQFDAHDAQQTMSSRKRFAITSIPFEKVVALEKKRIPSDSELQEFFSRQKARGQYREPERRSGLAWQITPEQYGVTVGSDAVKEYYEQHKEEKYLQQPSKVAVRRILIRSDVDNAAEKARTIRDSAVSDPTQFAELAQKHSQDSASAADGGMLAAFSRDSDDVGHALKVASFLLKGPGAISDLISTSEGYEVVQLVERVAPVHTPFSDVKKEITQTLVNVAFTRQLSEDLSRMPAGGNSPGERLMALAKERGIAPEPITNQAVRDSSLASRLFRLEQGGTELFTQDGVAFAIQLTEVTPARNERLDEVKDQVVADLQEERATLRIREQLEKSNSPQDIVAWAKQIAGSTEDTDWIEPRDQKQLQQLSERGLPLNEMLSLNKSGMFITHEHGLDGQLIVLKELKEASEPLTGDDMAGLERQLRQQREMLSKGGFVASLQRGAIIKTSESVRGIS